MPPSDVNLNINITAGGTGIGPINKLFAQSGRTLEFPVNFTTAGLARFQAAMASTTQQFTQTLNQQITQALANIPAKWRSAARGRILEGFGGTVSQQLQQARTQGQVGEIVSRRLEELSEFVPTGTPKQIEREVQRTGQLIRSIGKAAEERIKQINANLEHAESEFYKAMGPKEFLMQVFDPKRFKQMHEAALRQATEVPVGPLPPEAMARLRRPILDFGAPIRTREAQTQLMYAGLYGGLPGMLGGWLGGATGMGVKGITLGSTAVQAGLMIGEQVTRPFTEKLAEAEEAGKAFEKSILGITAVLEQSSQVIDMRTRKPLPPEQLGRELEFQQERAKQIQFEARAKVLPLGIAGATEATLVQGVVSSLASRGFQFSPQQVAKISERIGGGVLVQRPQLLENTTLFLRDLQDMLSGGPQAKRVLISQLAGFREAVPGIVQARSTEDIIKALDSLSKFPEAAKGLNNPIVAMNRLTGATDQLNTSFGAAYLETIAPAVKGLAEALSDPSAIEGAKALGAAMGSLAAVGNEAEKAMVNLSLAIAGIPKNFAEYYKIWEQVGQGKLPTDFISRQMQAASTLGVAALEEFASGKGTLRGFAERARTIDEEVQEARKRDKAVEEQTKFAGLTAQARSETQVKQVLSATGLTQKYQEFSAELVTSADEFVLAQLKRAESLSKSDPTFGLFISKEIAEREHKRNTAFLEGLPQFNQAATGARARFERERGMEEAEAQAKIFQNATATTNSIFKQYFDQDRLQRIRDAEAQLKAATAQATPAAQHRRLAELAKAPGTVTDEQINAVRNANEIVEQATQKLADLTRGEELAGPMKEAADAAKKITDFKLKELEYAEKEEKAARTMTELRLEGLNQKTVSGMQAASVIQADLSNKLIASKNQELDAVEKIMAVNKARIESEEAYLREAETPGRKGVIPGEAIDASKRRIRDLTEANVGLAAGAEQLSLQKDVLVRARETARVQLQDASERRAIEKKILDIGGQSYAAQEAQLQNQMEVNTLEQKQARTRTESLRKQIAEAEAKPGAGPADVLRSQFEAEVDRAKTLFGQKQDIEQKQYEVSKARIETEHGLKLASDQLKYAQEDEIIHRQQLNMSIEASKSALDRFSETAETALLGKEEGLYSIEKQAQAAGLPPSGLFGDLTDPERVAALDKEYLERRRTSMYREVGQGAPGRTGPKFLTEGGGGPFQEELERQRKGLELTLKQQQEEIKRLGKPAEEAAYSLERLQEAADRAAASLKRFEEKGPFSPLPPAPTRKPGAGGAPQGSLGAYLPPGWDVGEGIDLTQGPPEEMIPVEGGAGPIEGRLGRKYTTLLQRMHRGRQGRGTTAPISYGGGSVLGGQAVGLAMPDWVNPLEAIAAMQGPTGSLYTDLEPGQMRTDYGLGYGREATFGREASPYIRARPDTSTLDAAMAIVKPRNEKAMEDFKAETAAWADDARKQMQKSNSDFLAELVKSTQPPVYTPPPFDASKMPIQLSEGALPPKPPLKSGDIAAETAAQMKAAAQPSAFFQGAGPTPRPQGLTESPIETFFNNLFAPITSFLAGRPPGPPGEQSMFTPQATLGPTSDYYRTPGVRATVPQAQSDLAGMFRDLVQSVAKQAAEQAQATAAAAGAVGPYEPAGTGGFSVGKMSADDARKVMDAYSMQSLPTEIRVTLTPESAPVITSGVKGAAPGL